MLTIQETNNLAKVLQDKDTVCKKDGDLVVCTLKVEKKYSITEFDIAASRAKQAEEIASEKPIIETKRDEFYPERPEEPVIEPIEEPIINK